jgi:hypothetical protein
MLHALRQSRSLGAFAVLLVASWLWGIGLSSSHGHADHAYPTRLAHRAEPIQIGTEPGVGSSSERCAVCQYLRSLRTSLDPAVASIATLHPLFLPVTVPSIAFDSTPAPHTCGRAPPLA